MRIAMPQVEGTTAVETNEPSPPLLPEEYRTRLLSLRRRHNWDGEGARAVTARACRGAVKFVEAIRYRQPDLPLPRPAPSVRGAVSLYWQNENEHLVASIASNDPARVLLHWEGPSGRFKNRTLPFDAAVDDVLAFRPR